MMKIVRNNIGRLVRLVTGRKEISKRRAGMTYGKKTGSNAPKKIGCTQLGKPAKTINFVHAKRSLASS